MKLNGRFWLTKDDKSFLGAGRVELLEKIEEFGSISAAAKEMKMSYKAAWERLEAMNALASKPLLERVVGGKGGGGTKLTPYAHELMATFYRFNELHKEFMERFAEAGDDPQRLARILSRTFLTTSARNQLHARVKEIKDDGVNKKLTLALYGGDVLHSSITADSVVQMGIEEGCEVYAIIKASDVELTKEPGRDGSLSCVVLQLRQTGEMVEAVLQSGAGVKIVAVVSAFDELRIGLEIFACVKSSNVLIGV